ncbi:hypothetical protein COL05_12850 [Bacillus sp. AFS059628]|uniref:hypothetical protein n=1 Tax=Bacillus sp. AFS059628 TaxID=2033508 RepID=UPI000BF985DB|nr:hypothetical protein [Bacillus sp. AFS059628]PFV81737.1 hypothetical protein COL05_12850 [Bacillus sp. AFS059628]
MRKIDLVTKLLDLETSIMQGLKPISDAGLDGIYEIFTMLEVEDAVNVLLKGVFKELYLENVTPYCEGSETEKEFTERLIHIKHDLADDISPAEKLELISFLLDMERERYLTYIEFSDLGVSFDIYPTMDALYDFINQLISVDVGDSLHCYTNGEISKQEILDFISDKWAKKI